MANSASEQQADMAIERLSKWIEAARNSNQHGENMVHRAATLAIIGDDELEDIFSTAMSNVHDIDTTTTDFAKACVRALRNEAP